MVELPDSDRSIYIHVCPVHTLCETPLGNSKALLCYSLLPFFIDFWSLFGIIRETYSFPKTDIMAPMQDR